MVLLLVNKKHSYILKLESDQNNDILLVIQFMYIVAGVPGCVTFTDIFKKG